MSLALAKIKIGDLRAYDKLRPFVKAKLNIS